jgi:hypothetical protein
MTNVIGNTMTLTEFERLLEVYGSDRTRWPVAARASAGQLVARVPSARRLLAETEALDRVLERAPMTSLAREAALAERIVAAARRSPRMVAKSAGAAPPSGSVVASEVRQPRWLGGAAGALAASLVVGVLIGLSSLSQSVLPALEQMTGVALSPPQSLTTQVDLLDEDLL